jgi:hypothetical protein
MKMLDMFRDLSAAGLVLILLLASAGRMEASSPSKEELLLLLTTETDVDPLQLRAVPAENFQRQEQRGQTVGRVQRVQGTVLFIPKGGYDAYHLDKSAPVAVHDGDTLITAKNSRVTLLMNDKSKLTLTPQSKMVIDKSLHDPAANRRDTKLRLLLGRLRAVVAKITGDNAYTIQTPTATAGVRGTDFALAVNPEMTALLTGGGDSTVELTSGAGGRLTVGPFSVAGVCPSCRPAYVDESALDVLHEIAPELDPHRKIRCLPIFKMKSDQQDSL